MPRQINPLTQAVLDRLSDNQWHDYEDVIRDVEYLIPPGVAYKQAEFNYQVRYPDKERKVEPDKKSLVRSGQRYLVVRTLISLRSTGKVEVLYSNEQTRRKPKSVRLIPR